MYTYVGGRNEPHKWTYKCVCPGRVRGEYSITSLLPDAANPTRSRKYNCTLYLGQCVLRKNVRVWRKVDSLLASCSCLWLRSLDTQRPVRGNNKAVLWSRFALLFHVTQSCILPTHHIHSRSSRRDIASRARANTTPVTLPHRNTRCHTHASSTARNSHDPNASALFSFPAHLPVRSQYRNYEHARKHKRTHRQSYKRSTIPHPQRNH